MCMRTTPAPDSAATRAMSGSPRSAVTSLMIDGSSGQGQLGDLGLGRVDGEGNARRREASCFDDREHPPQLLVQRHRVRSWAGGFAAQVEQSRPRRGSGPAHAPTAASGVKKRPPSEKLSGVTLTMPITRGTRSFSARIGRSRASHRGIAVSSRFGRLPVPCFPSVSRARGGRSFQVGIGEPGLLHHIDDLGGQPLVDPVIGGEGRLADFGHEVDRLGDDVGGRLFSASVGGLWVHFTLTAMVMFSSRGRLNGFSTTMFLSAKLIVPSRTVSAPSGLPTTL